MHSIQEKILHTLMLHEKPQRYRDVNVFRVPNDLFNYHLQTLCKKGLVDKQDGLYQLSLEGKQVVEDILALGAIRPKADRFKLYAHAIILNPTVTEVISRQRLRQPFFGDRGIHGVSVRRGEVTTDAVKRHYRKTLDIEVSELTLHGIVRKIRTVKGSVFSDMIHYLYVCYQYSGEPDFKAPFAKGLSWRNVNEAVADEKKTLTPINGLVTLLEMIGTKTLNHDTFFHDEVVYSLKSLEPA